ncbi:SEC-C metal-binding domain-containing protein [Inquilinus sp. CA228]
MVEKLGRRDPCPCGSGLSFQALLPEGQALRRDDAEALRPRLTL